AREQVDAQLVGARLVVDQVVELHRQLHVKPRYLPTGRVLRLPRLEGGRRHGAGRPELVAAVAAVVDESGGAQPAVRAVDGQARVGDVDIARLFGCSHVRFWILRGGGLRGRRTAADILLGRAGDAAIAGVDLRPRPR